MVLLSWRQIVKLLLVFSFFILQIKICIGFSIGVSPASLNFNLSENIDQHSAVIINPNPFEVTVQILPDEYVVSSEYLISISPFESADIIYSLKQPYPSIDLSSELIILFSSSSSSALYTGIAIPITIQGFEDQENNLNKSVSHKGGISSFKDISTYAVASFDQTSFDLSKVIIFIIIFLCILFLLYLFLRSK